ncbi:MAG: Mor transcription activator family protein [Methylococcaceae bacterium]
MSLLPDNYPEMLTDFHDNILDEICKLEAPSHEQLAFSITELFRRQFGGSMLYIPFGMHHDLNIRNAEIYSKFTGDNHKQLGREFGISTKQIYCVVKKMEKAERKITARF